MSDSFDFVCVGNSVVDLFLQIHEENKHVTYNQENNSINVALGDKINLDGYKICLGGGATNVAVGLSRLGLKTSVVSQIGNDEFSEKILNMLSEEKVSTKDIARNKETDSSFSIILNYKKERTIFSEHMAYESDFKINGNSSWIYLASLGKNWQKGYDTVLSYITTNNANLAFNPGIIEIESQSASLYKLLEKSSVLILNKYEANMLVEHSDRETIDLLRELKKMGPRNVIITDGPKGSYVIDNIGHGYYMNSFPSNMVDPTGAGDAFSTGFLYGQFLGKGLNESMRLAATEASYSSEEVGAQSGLIKKEDLEEKLQRFEQYNLIEYNG